MNILAIFIAVIPNVYTYSIYYVYESFQGAFFNATTRSYQQIPLLDSHSQKSIKAPTACRAVARAKGSNQLAIIIPWDRVINANGEFGGYAGGNARKQWLLNHEKKYKTG